MRDSQFELVVMGLFHCVLTLGLLLTYLPFLDLRGAPAWIRVEDHLAILSLALLTGACCSVPRLAWRRPFGRPRQLLPATLPGGSGGSSTLDGRLSRCLPSSAGPTQCSLQE